MPERDKQTDAMARTLAGAGPRPALDRLGTQPVEVTEQEWHDARAMADRVYVDLVEAVDFQRVLIEAVKRHATVHPDKATFMAAADIGFGSAEALCHECITEVLLATDTNPPWSEEPESPRYLLYRDPAHGDADAYYVATPPARRTLLGTPETPSTSDEHEGPEAPSQNFTDHLDAWEGTFGFPPDYSGSASWGRGPGETW